MAAEKMEDKEPAGDDKKAPAPKTAPRKNGIHISVLSLSARCGGMTLGMEGGFEAMEACIPETIRSICEKGSRKGWLKLPMTAFDIIAATDAFNEAATA